jgi:P4 family phage/plasmid primase-like protien
MIFLTFIHSTMFEIIGINDDQSETYDSIILKIFKHFDEYYLLDDLYMKCAVFETNDPYRNIYFFPLLPNDLIVRAVILKDSHVSNDYNNCQVLDLKYLYPNSFKKCNTLTEFIGHNSLTELRMDNGDIAQFRNQCLNIDTDISIRMRSNIDERNQEIHNLVEKFKDGEFNYQSMWNDTYGFNSRDELSLIEMRCKSSRTDLRNFTNERNKVTLFYTAYYGAYETEFSVSSVFCNMFSFRFICSDNEKRIVYIFKRHRWVLNNGGVDIKKAIFTDFPNEIIALTADNENPHIHKAVQKMCLVIQNQNSRSKILNDCCTILYDGKFSKLKNTINNLLAFKNGIYNIECGKLHKGMPDNYITLSTNIPYYIFDIESQAIKDLMDFLDKVFPVKNILKYFVRFLSSCLEGGNKDKIFSIWSGLGDNGKSVLVNLISIAFGEYSIKLPTSLLTGRRSQSSSATPELSMIEGTLISFLQEPDEGDKMNLGIVKELTGNDSIYVRGLYEQGRNINIRSKFVLVANRIPRLNAIDKAAWNRIKVIPFLSTFVDEIEDDVAKREYVYIKNPNLSAKLPHLAPALMYLLTEEYKNYKLYGLEEPDEIASYTRELKTANDPIKQFIESSIEVDENCIERIRDLYDMYKTWFRDMFPNGRIMDSANFSRELKKKGFDINSIGQVLGVKKLNYY